MVLSFIIYFTVFIVSSFASSRYDTILDRHADVDEPNRKSFVIRIHSFNINKFIWILLVLAPPIFISTFRAIEIGTDTATYLGIYDYNKDYNLFEYLKIYGTWGHDYEIGYQQILRISYILGGGYNLVKCLCSFLIVFFAWRGAVYYHKKFQVSSGTCMFFFYLLEFTYGLNGVRYAIALSLFFYGFQFVIEKKLIKYLICYFLMMMFHSSLILAAAFYLINVVRSNASRKYFKYVAIIAVIAVVVFLRPLVDNVLPVVGRNFARFGLYSVETTEAYGLGIFLVFALFLAPLIRWNEYLNMNTAWTFILVSCLAFIPFRFMGYFSQWLIRLSRMPEILFCVLYGGAMILPVSKTERVVWKIYTTVLLVGYYILNVIVQNSGEVYPYLFDFTNHI